MGDSNARAVRTITRSGGSSAAAKTVSAAFTRQGTIKKGASKAVIQRAKEVLRSARSANKQRRKAAATAREGQSVMGGIARTLQQSQARRARLRE